MYMVKYRVYDGNNVEITAISEIYQMSVFISISCFSHATVVNQYKSSESILYCFYNMFLRAPAFAQVTTSK
jgi:hypothetical protein